MKNIWWYLFVAGIVLKIFGSTDYVLIAIVPLIIGAIVELGYAAWEMKAKKKRYDSWKIRSVTDAVMKGHSKRMSEHMKNR